MSERTLFLYGPLPSRDSLEQAHPVLQGFVCFNVHQVGARYAVLRNEDGLLAPLQLGKKLCGLALQSCDEFGSHRSDTIVALRFLQAPGNEVISVYIFLSPYSGQFDASSGIFEEIKLGETSPATSGGYHFRY